VMTASALHAQTPPCNHPVCLFRSPYSDLVACAAHPAPVPAARWAAEAEKLQRSEEEANEKWVLLCQLQPWLAPCWSHFLYQQASQPSSAKGQHPLFPACLLLC
jgi:hypothetical protein